MTPWHDPALLARLARVRAPWDALTARVVRAAVARFVPPGLLVEVGAGGGQLRAWLPPDRAADTTHTDTSAPFLDVLRADYPDAAVALAPVTALPFADGALAGVLGLCVLDALPDAAAARDEFRRVLRPGGVVLHVLDLATSPGGAFAELIARGEFPLPNFARDPGVLEALTDAQRALLPAADDFDEVLAVPWAAYSRFAGMWAAARHPLAADVLAYADPADAAALDPDALAQRFMHFRNNPDRLRVLYRALLGLTLTARQLGRDWPLRGLSLRAHLRDRLTRTFAGGFEVVFAGPVLAREPAAGENVLRHAGKTVPGAAALPAATAVDEWDGPAAPPTGAWRATTVEVFAARRA
ncbi:methyltransferase domain-containing protein [Urbifossiella limnaea]|uniref:Methyltransferase domain protein n=1 Tax=Urbifossiella limnaea TaxID=2528023 RepID=A0A517XLV1_9BACT|nr:methyltransferase domain-containing protein [Urbifossiella limnaea]QDU18490.1 Methyltransferase domain protein [Urbifossiella limnaea]